MRSARPQCAMGFDMKVHSVALVCVWAVGLLCGALAPAATVNGLYDAQVPVADRSERAREQAFGVALAAVAVRVSGRSDAGARLGATGGAKRYVQRYGYVPGGLLDVGFDSAGVDQLLEQAGLPTWGRERPSVAVLLPVGLAASAEARGQVEQAARARGVPLVIPAGETSGVTDASQLAALAAKYRTDAVLIGHLSGNAAGPAQLDWTFALGPTVSETQGSLHEGVNFAADACARLYATAANVAAQVLLDVAGIVDLDAYAKTLNYLSALSVVRGVQVESVARDVVRFKLNLRGDQDALRRTIALERLLVADTASGSDRLYFKYQP